MAVEPAPSKEELAERRSDWIYLAKSIAGWTIVSAICVGILLFVVELINRGYILL